jgi:hypothetical protein
MDRVRNVVCRHTNREVLIATACVADSADVMEIRGAALQTHHA